MIYFDERTTEERENSNDIYYTEVNEESNKGKHIIHLIMAHESSEAGNFYNN